MTAPPSHTLLRAFPATHALHISCKALFVFGLLCSISCNRQEALNPNAGLQQDDFQLHTQNADTLISIGDYIPLDSLAPPQSVPVGTPPPSQVFSAHPNRFPAGEPDVVPLPKKVPATGKVIPARQPEPVLAPPLQLKDGAFQDFRHLEIELGAGSGNVNAVLEDSRGYLWLATSAGLVRYDGKYFLHYTQKEGLEFTNTHSPLEDSQGRIWFANYGGGVSCYDGVTFTHYSEKEGLSSNIIHTMLEDRQGTIWIGTYQGGVSRFDGTHFTHYTVDEGLGSNTVGSIYEDKQGNIWFGNYGAGVSCFDGTSFTHFTVNDGFLDKVINFITEDDQGKLWFGTNKGLSCFDGTQFFNYTRNLKAPMVKSIVHDGQNRMWLALHDNTRTNSGVSVFDKSTFTHFTVNEGLSGYWLGRMQKDAHGAIWIPTSNNATRLEPEGFTNFSMANGLPFEQQVSDFAEDTAGNLWIGTWLGGLIRFDGAQFIQYTKTEGLIANIINQFVLDKNGNLWFDTGLRGIVHFPGKTFLHYKPDSNLYLRKPLLCDSKGNLWFGTPTSAVRYDGKGFTPFTLKENDAQYAVESILEDKKGNIWFGLWGNLGLGLIRYDGKSFTLFMERDGRGVVSVKAMLDDSRGNIWFGTNDGLVCFDGARFTRYREKEGLGSNYVYKLIQDRNDNIWVGRHNGLSLLIHKSRLPKNAGNAGEIPGQDNTREYRIYNFDARDGLQGKSQQTIYVDRKNRLLLGHEKGMSVLDLNHFELPTKPPTLGLSHIAIQQQFIDYRSLADSAYRSTIPFADQLGAELQKAVPFHNYPEKLTLPYALNHLTFHFSATDWAAPHKIRYSYYIKNVDKSWSLPQVEPVADYRNLPAGTHTLQVRAIGAAQVWSPPFEYTFTILPPWYRTWWAYLLYLLTTGGIVYAGWRYELRRQLARAEAERLQELDQAKTRLYTNITHEFRTPLTVILGMEEQLRKNPGAWLDEGLRLIRRNGEQLFRLINQLLDLSKLESGHLPLRLVQGDVVSYLHYLTESFHSYAESKDIRLHFLSDVDTLPMDHDPEKLQHIISNLLSNAIKFTPAGGDVYLQLATEKSGDPESETLCSIRVKDTGIGIPEDQLPHIFDRFYQVDDSYTRSSEGAGVGLALVQELVKLMHGTVEVKSELGKGTEFHIRLPITRTAAPETAVAKPDIPEEVAATLALPEPGTEKRIPPEPGDRNTVLLVEDNPDVIAYLSTVLARHYRIETARDGREGIAKALEQIPDVIVSDVMMPGTDGFELCKTLKTDERTSHIPIILLTAKADQPSKIEGLTYGADAYLAKPFNQEELLVRLEKLIELRRNLQARFQQAGRLRQTIGRKGKSLDELFLQKVVRIVEAKMADEAFGMPELCKALNMSQSNLFRKLKALTGRSTTAFIRSMRLEKAKELLETTDMNVSEVCFAVGFNSPNYFSRVFQEEFGVAPSKV